MWYLVQILLEMPLNSVTQGAQLLNVKLSVTQLFCSSQEHRLGSWRIVKGGTQTEKFISWSFVAQ